MRRILLASILVVISIASACSSTETVTVPGENATVTETAIVTVSSSPQPIQYSQEILQAVVDESVSRLKSANLMDKVAGLAYGIDDIELLFYEKTDQTAVGIVQSVINALAPGFPLKIVENVTIVLDTVR